MPYGVFVVDGGGQNRGSVIIQLTVDVSVPELELMVNDVPALMV